MLSYIYRELEACNHYLSSLSSCLNYLLSMHNSSEKGCLFPIEEHTAADLFATAETINQFSFYGRCVGIQVRKLNLVLYIYLSSTYF